MKRHRINNTIRISSENPFTYGAQGTTNVQDNVYEEAVVLDVITNDTHPSYSQDGFNVGTIKCRLLQSQWFDSDDFVSTAVPLEANISQYPLINEVVVIVRVLSKFYYLPKINISNRVTAQPFFGLIEEMSSGNGKESNANSYEKSTATSKRNTSQDFSLGKQFKENPVVHRLRHQEGDVVVEGRSGHSIRLGTDSQTLAPNLLMRVGQDPKARLSVNSQFGLVDEDINNDLSSVWLVSNQTVPIKLSTVGTDAHFKSVVNPPTNFQGNQIILNSDRIILNSKVDDVFINTFNGLHLTSAQDTTIDVNHDYRSFIKNDCIITIDGNYNKTVNKDVEMNVQGNITITNQSAFKETSSGNRSIIANKIFLGSVSDDSEPMVLGDSLITFLEGFVDAHLNNASAYVMTPTGPGNLLPSVATALTQLKSELQKRKQASFVSQDNFITKTNG